MEEAVCPQASRDVSRCARKRNPERVIAGVTPRKPNGGADLVEGPLATHWNWHPTFGGLVVRSVRGGRESSVADTSGLSTSNPFGTAESRDRHRTGIVRVGLLGLTRPQQASPRGHYRPHIDHPLTSCWDTR